MDKAIVVWIIIALILIVIVVGYTYIDAKRKSYKPYELNSDGCEHYFKNCICIGTVVVLETYPEQFNCQGWEICKQIDETQCR